MSGQSRTVSLSTPDETCRLAQALAPHLGAGDVLLLDGPIGAGKTHFSRCLIQALLSVPEDVPSPTFTIVQVYDTARFEVWHVDLYRITGPDGCIELGLTEAFETALCLVEWPDRLGILTPPNALAISLSTGAHDEDRTLVFAWTAQRWAPILDEVLA